MATRDRKKKPEDLKVTPEQHAHLKRIGTQRGQPSRNPEGRPAIPEILKQKAADMSPEALEGIYNLALTSTNEMVRFRCYEYILSLNVSKAAQEQKMTLDVGPGIADLLASAGSRHNTIHHQPAPLVIDAELVEEDPSL